ncbi:MAG: LysM domain-containing protein [bacterium]
MRFKWRRRLAVTAFALGSMLPFAGCSSQQQQASDEVAAEGQGQQEEGGQQEEVAETQQGGESQGEETAQEAPANGEATAEVSGEENGVAGNNVVSNEAPAADGEAGDGGDLQSMITEMNGSNQAQPAAEEVAAPAEAQAAAEVAAPVDAGQVPAEATQVAEAAAVPGMPEMGSKMAYVVEAGDTLGKIASKIYGDQKRWRDIANLSGMDNPNHIYPGDIIYYSLEESSRNFASAYEGIRRAKEIVQDGDTLAAISKRVYGTSKAWRHIWRQNDNIDNPDVLTAGMAVYYVEKGAFNAAMTKVKGMNVAKAAKASAQKVFKSAKVGQKSNVTAQSYAFIGSSV